MDDPQRMKKNNSSLRCNECFHVAVKGLGLAVDVVLCHGVPVLADSGFEDRIVWKTAIKGWTSRL
uniref:Uncharacterized protein n=1 Tax=Lepeophtheirus salmonis TaxID=72036 RepID=A0A0K2UBX0_LEPSM